MAFKLGDMIVDRLQFGYGAKKNGTPLYAITQLKEASINVTADSTDITDKDGNLVYRKYSGKKGDISAQNAFINLAVIEALSATDAEIATDEKGIIMPIITTVRAGETLDVTGYVEGTIFVNALSESGTMGAEYKLGSTANETDFSVAKVSESDKTILTPPTDSAETQYIVKYNKTVHSGAKITNTGDKFPKAHELFFKALVVDTCDKETLRAAIIHIPSFIPSPELTLSLQGGENQTIDYKGAMMVDTCSLDKEMFSLYYVDEIEE